MRAARVILHINEGGPSDGILVTAALNAPGHAPGRVFGQSSLILAANIASDRSGAPTHHFYAIHGTASMGSWWMHVAVWKHTELLT
jgi:hypothetical protein